MYEPKNGFDRLKEFNMESDKYEWNEINQALMKLGYSPKKIVKVLESLNNIKRCWK